MNGVTASSWGKWVIARQGMFTQAEGILGFKVHGVPGDTQLHGNRTPGNSRGDVLGVIAGHTNIVLAHGWSVRV